MNIHVFVVDRITLKLHLEYMFAGTGAEDKKSPFLSNVEACCHHSTERNLVGMIADISRIRQNDKIIFYLQAADNNPGRFFGIFKAESTGFFDDNDESNYLKDKLGKGLSFRVSISADTVYPYGITEHEYLDDLDGKESPFELCWSMIYRKLKGNRGCTMITQYEFEDLQNKLKKKNNGKTLKGNNFSFDAANVKIIETDVTKKYTGRKNNLDIEPRLIYKASRRNAFETHLQALIMQKYDDDVIKDELLTLNNGSAWVGNEVSCGVGMQRIDILIIEHNDAEIHVKVVELKDEKPYESILNVQLPWYLKWVLQYMVPNLLKYNKKIIIHPSIIAKKTAEGDDIVNKIKEKTFIELKNVSILKKVKLEKTEYIGFEIDDNHINFEKIV